MDKNALAQSVPRRIFTIYLAAALLLTVFQVAILIQHARTQVKDELDAVARSFMPGLASAVWDFQTPMIETIAIGMENGQTILGVEVYDDKGKPLYAHHIGSDADSAIVRSVDLRYKRNNGETKTVGKLRIFSSDRVVLERVLTDVMVALAAAAVKTAILWLIIDYVVTRLMVRPLGQFVAQIHETANGNLYPQVLVDAPKGSEIAVVRDAFNSLSRRVERMYRTIEQANIELENRVSERTQSLETAVRELRAIQEQLVFQEKMASIGQLAAGVAHEINNPIGFVNSNLGTLRTYVQALLAIIEGDEHALAHLPDHALLRACFAQLRAQHELDFLKGDVATLMDESFDGMHRVKAIVQALKEFSHVGEMDWQAVDLHRNIDSTLTIVHNEFRQRAEVKREYGSLPLVTCLISQLNQVFMNLLVNAAHAIGEAGVITVRTGCEGDWVWVEIGDNGVGIPKEIQNRIFEPFFTTKPIGKGTGLGLSLSHNIVSNHGGRIDVVSQPGEGTRFTVHLPIYPAASDVPARDEPAPAAAH